MPLELGTYYNVKINNTDPSKFFLFVPCLLLMLIFKFTDECLVRDGVETVGQRSKYTPPVHPLSLTSSLPQNQTRDMELVCASINVHVN